MQKESGSIVVSDGLEQLRNVSLDLKEPFLLR